MFKKFHLFHQEAQILSGNLGLIMNHEEQADKVEQFADIKNSMPKLVGKCHPLRNVLIEMSTCS